jgi:hypothetical protein
MTQPITNILSRYYGKPALVIGGGPSVRDNLPVLEDQGFKPAVVLSANEHGLHQAHYKVDFLVNVDRVHCVKKVMMEDYLRQFGVQVINAHSWADYRLPDWKMSANSGIQAIAVACVLGCWPVVVTGVDLFMIGRQYFHVADEKPRNRPSLTYMAKQRITEMRRWAGDYPVRPVSGPLTQVFPTYDPAETFSEPERVPYRKKIEKAPVKWYRGLHEFSFVTNDRVAPGELVPFTPTEARPYIERGWLEEVDAVRPQE